MRGAPASSAPADAPTASAAPAGDAAASAWSWVDHLRAGGATPWAVWAARGVPGGPGAEPRPLSDLPGAAQLETLRRLSDRADRADPGPDAPVAAAARLAGLVLDRSAPGRGMPELPLALPGVPAARVGPAPVDPAAVPTRELVRVAAGLVVDLLVGSPDGTSAAVGPGGAGGPGGPGGPGRRRRLAVRRAGARRRNPSPAFRVVGPTGAAATVRNALAAHGHVEGGGSPHVVVLLEPLDRWLAETWSARVQAGASPRWRRYVGRWAGRDQLPALAAPAVVAAGWAERVGADRLTLLASEAPVRDAAAVLGLSLDGCASRDERAVARHRPRPLAPAATALLREVNTVLPVRVGPGRRRRLLAALVDLLPATGGPLAVPVAARPWLDERAAGVLGTLREAGYPVHGDPARLLPGHRGPTAPPRAEVLQVALDAVLALAAAGDGGSR